MQRGFHRTRNVCGTCRGSRDCLGLMRTFSPLCFCRSFIRSALVLPFICCFDSVTEKSGPPPRPPSKSLDVLFALRLARVNIGRHQTVKTSHNQTGVLRDPSGVVTSCVWVRPGEGRREEGYTLSSSMVKGESCDWKRMNQESEGAKRLSFKAGYECELNTSEVLQEMGSMCSWLIQYGIC